MTRTRGPELSKEFRDYIFGQFVYKQLNAYQIADQVNTDSDLLSKFGKTTPAGIHYHLVRIKEDMNNSLNEDALDTYIVEWMRAKEGLDQDVIALNDMIDAAEEDPELVLKIRRLRHEIKIDKFKLLQDSELPLTVKKLKAERALYRPKKDIVKMVEDNTSQEANIGTTHTKYG